MDGLGSVLVQIRQERVRQDAKWGPQDHSDIEWSLILAEEFGEAMKECNEVHFRDKDPAELRKELVQVAAVAVHWLENMGRRKKSGAV